MSNIIETQRFILTECDENHNKWWEIELLDNNDIITRWARVGNDPQSKTFIGVGKSFMDKKIREKTKKGYSPLKTIGSSSAASSSTSVKSNVELHEIARKQIIKTSNPILEKLIKRLVDSNIHKITSNTQITYNSTTGLFSTPLGVVSMEGIVEARELLAKMTTFVRSNKFNSDLNGLLSQYLRIIPQNLGMKRFSAETILPDDNAIQKQADLISSLESSYQALQTNSLVTTGAVEESVFKTDLDVLNDSTEIDRLTRWFSQSNHSSLGYGNVKIRNFYKIKIHDYWNNFNEKLGNLKEVWHGSGIGNVLSIFKTGLKVSPPATTKITGKMFLDGHYGALDSSKSMQYTFGRFNGQYSDDGFLFVADFSLGNTYYIKTYGGGKPAGYDSIWAKKENTGLKFDELIVPTDSQVRLKYLLELK